MMMLHTEMNPLMHAAAATAAAAAANGACNDHQLFIKRQNSFEDEVESIYLSSFTSDLKKQDQQLLQRQHHQLQDHAFSSSSKTLTASAAAPNDGLGLAAAGLLIKTGGQDPYDSMDFAVARPEDVTGQTLAYKVEDPEEDDDVSNLLSANFDFSKLMDDPADDLNLAGTAGNKVNGLNTTGNGSQEGEADAAAATEMEGQKVIDEMKEFLGRFETTTPAAAAAAAATVNNSCHIQPAASATTTTSQEGMVETDESALPESLAEELLSLEQRINLNNMPAAATSEFPLMDETDLAQAEEMLDLLLADAGSSEQAQQQQLLQQQQQTDILHEAMLSQNLHDSGFVDQQEEEEEEVIEVADEMNGSVVIPDQQVAAASAAAAPIIPTYNVSNVTQFQTADGKKVIIVIQPASAHAAAGSSVTNVAGTSLAKQHQPAAVAAAAAPAAVAAVTYDDVAAEDSSDSDWTPDEAAKTAAASKKKPGRKPEVRASLPVTQDGRVAKRSYKAITDRKKRKKMQNVEAARRYRDKKKQEQSEMETEENILLAKNKDLKEQLADIENEFKTMKKLMIELGLVKFVK